MDIIVDIDGTLADNSHRQHFLKQNEPQWLNFFEAMKDDQPIWPVCHLIDALLFDDNNILLCSGRSEDYRELTSWWLKVHDIYYTELYMRASNDFRPDHVVKAELLDCMKEDGYQPQLVIDDRKQVVDMWREKGLVCLQNEDKITK